MTIDTADYLARLDAALRDVPHGIASDIRAGIAEELAGLATDAAAARIAQLGDPETIAREALEAGGAQRTAPAVPEAPLKPVATGTKGFAITAALVLSFGGFVIPVVGWLVGAVLVLMSGLWRSWEKAVALAAVPIAVLGFGLASLLPLAAVESSGEDAVANPLLPMGFSAWHLAFILAFVLMPASGLWLLWRLRGRTTPSAS
ncbi:hypothetical protein ACFVAE_15205 [Microbacterium sp. NPDC057659]|uniref:HAAS signaling domain-containing protein n=1 Tax=Microbacterium sp. NPDC057659 TaxID=3346198 RepID=UPI0036733E2E